MDPNEDTEWNDALRKHGILPEKPPDPNDEFEETLQRVVKEAEDNRLENLNLNELDELEDDEDEDFLESYRQKRMQEIREFNSAARYGTVEPLTKPDFVKQVTEQSDSVWVFVHLFKDYLPQCKLLAAVLNDFAKKYPTLKILKIPGDQCIEGYPDRLMPTILVYGPKGFRSQVVGLADLGGNNTRVSDLERYAEGIGALSKAELRVSRDREVDEGGTRGMRKSVVNQADDDDDWD